MTPLCDLLAQFSSAGPFGPPQTRAYRCEACEAPLPDRRAWLAAGGLCPSCAAARVARAHAERIQAVRETIPARFRDARFRTPAIAERVPSRLARAAAERALGALVVTLFGPPGCGKTTLAAALLNAALAAADKGNAPARRRALGAHFVLAFELAEARSQHALGEDEAPLVAEALDSTFLVIDDLGKEPPRKRDALVQVIHTRHATGRPTVITTELDADAIARVYATEASSGEYLQRRLFEAPAAVIDVARMEP